LDAKSYFADEMLFLKHLGDNPWFMFWNNSDGSTRKAILAWKADFEDLICAMTNFDPGKRIMDKIWDCRNSPSNVTHKLVESVLSTFVYF